MAGARSYLRTGTATFEDIHRLVRFESVPLAFSLAMALSTHGVRAEPFFSNYAITGPPVVDLNWSSGGISGPATANSQSTFTVSRTYTIAGAATGGSFTIAYYASTDTTFGDANDIILGTETISAADAPFIARMS